MNFCLTGSLLLVVFFIPVWSFAPNRLQMTRSTPRFTGQLARLNHASDAPSEKLLKQVGSLETPTDLRLERSPLSFTPNSANLRLQSGEHIFLLDYAVRSWFDITPIPETSVSNAEPSRIAQVWGNFIAKCQDSNIDVSCEAPFCAADIGEQSQRTFSLARIPTTMHQKLSLARKLAETHRKGRNVTVHMLSLNAEYMIDLGMADAVLSAFQLHSYDLPSMKRSQPQKTGRTARAAEQSTVTIMLPERCYQAPEEGTQAEQELALEASILQASRDRFREKSERKKGGGSAWYTNTHVDAVTRLLQLTQRINQGTHVSRCLASLPPNVLTPGTYSRLLHSLADTKGWTVEEWSYEQLRDIGCGAFCAVGQADKSNPDRSARLVRLRSPDTLSTSETGTASLTDAGPGRQLGLGTMHSTEERRRPVVLVGKGVCYDTGGVNVKSAENMRHMKGDMAGSASALGTFLALTESGFAHPVECWLALAENNIHPEGYRPDEVLTCVTGETVEVVHTDAEGRLLLVDSLALASRLVTPAAIFGADTTAAAENAGGYSAVDTSSVGERGSGGGDARREQDNSNTKKADPCTTLSPKLLVDFGTLTGTCVTALSSRYIGAFSNRDCESAIIETGRQCGERAWSIPCDSDFALDLEKSDVADVLQCLPKTEADHIYAAALLRRSVKPTVPWLHLDLSSAHRPGGLGHVGSDFTGAGVRFAVHMIRKMLE